MIQTLWQALPEFCSIFYPHSKHAWDLPDKIAKFCQHCPTRATAPVTASDTAYSPSIKRCTSSFWPYMLAPIAGQTFSFLELFLQSPMESSSNYVSEVLLEKRQALTRIGFRPGFAPKALQRENPSKSRPFDPACNSA